MDKKTEIIPAILPKNFKDLEEKVSMILGLVKTVQVDICDGQFTHAPSWPYKKADDSFQAIMKEERGMPGWEKINYEFDLMVNRPEEVFEDWVRAGANRIVLHAEAKGDAGKAIEMLKDRVEVGLALNIDTPISVIGDPKLNIKEGSLQFIQFMGIDHIGFQGQEFDTRVIGKIKEIKKMCPDYPVSIDGGVSLENAGELIAAGADRLVIGSAIFDSDNFVEAIEEFKRIMSKSK